MLGPALRSEVKAGVRGYRSELSDRFSATARVCVFKARLMLQLGLDRFIKCFHVAQKLFISGGFPPQPPVE